MNDHQQHILQNYIHRKPLKIKLSNMNEIKQYQQSMLNMNKIKENEIVKMATQQKSRLLYKNASLNPHNNEKKQRQQSIKKSIGKSSYLIYKQKQKKQKNKLSKSQTISKLISLTQNFYYTWRFNKKTQNIQNTQNTTTFCNFNSNKSQIHDREQIRRKIRSTNNYRNKPTCTCVRFERTERVKMFKKTKILKPNPNFFKQSHQSTDLQSKIYRPWSPIDQDDPFQFL